jgi:transcriptional regulator with XRE-family HTH domain
MKLRRAILRISQEDLAIQSGVSTGYIANIETGRNFPSSEVIMKLCTAMKIEPWKLFIDPQKQEFGYSKNEISQIFDMAKSFILGELPNDYNSTKNLLNYNKDLKQ